MAKVACAKAQREEERQARLAQRRQQQDRLDAEAALDAADIDAPS